MRAIRTFVVAAGSVALLLTGCASEEKSTEPAIKDHMRQVSARVEAVDPVTRVVRLNGAEGVADIVMPPEVRNFDQIHVGDMLQVTYYTGIAAQIRKHGDPVPAATDEVVAARAEPGARPGAAVGRNISTTVTIEAVDTKKNMVTFRRLDGELKAVDVESPEGQKFIKTLKKGDQVDVTYTEAVAIEVVPAAK